MMLPVNVDKLGKCDLVLQGGGVRGTGLAGAVSTLRQSVYPNIQRVAGTSAGAIVAALIAAGYSDNELANLMHSLDYHKFRQTSTIGHLGFLGKGYDLVKKGGLYQTGYLHSWVAEALAAKGVRTWADLKYTDSAADATLTPGRMYRLVVIVTDLSRGRMLRLPWDYQALCDLDPDAQSVADAVTASASIPLYFQPMKLVCGPRQRSTELTLTDGGSLSNYAIDIFDRTDGRPYRWPTLGIRLSARQEPADECEYAGFPEILVRLFSAMSNGHDRVYTDQLSVQARTIFVDATFVKSTDFSLTDAQRDILYRNGQRAASKFLDTWDWAAWQKLYTL